MSNDRPRRKRGSTGDQQQVSKPVSELPIDATTLRMRQLRDILENQVKNKVLLHDLDFVDVEDETFRELFIPPNPSARKFHRREDGTIMLPPKAMRRSFSQITAFYNYGADQKKKELDKYKDYVIDRTGVISYTASPYCVSLQEPERPPSVAQPAAPAASPASSPASASLHPPQSPPMSSDFAVSPTPVPTKCGGISIQYLKNPKWRYSEDLLRRRH
jgi:hypothetical protein